MKELSNLEIAMLSPVKRQIYLKRRERARIKVIERIVVIPFLHPVSGRMFWVPLGKARVLAEAFSKLEEDYRTRRQLGIDDMLAEYEEES